MTEEVFNKIVSKLISKTTNNELNWSKTSGEKEFKVQLGNSAITIDNFGNNDEFYDFMIYNDKGDVVDTETHNSSSGAGKNQILADLYAIVHKKYYRIDDTFDEIFNQLDL